MRRTILGLLICYGALLAGVYSSMAYQPPIFGGKVPQAGQSGASIPAGVDLYALDNDNTIWRARSCEGEFRRLVRANLFAQNEQLVGIDFRPSDGLLYGISDAGTIYTIDVMAPGKGNVVRISQTSPRFTGGVQSLADFNPVVDALRLIGSNDQNLAVVNAGGNLGTTAMQTKISYATGDANQGQDPNLTGGSYTNNQPGAPLTIFYGLDYSAGTLVTIDPAAPGQSSATGGGQLRTVGKLTRFDGNPLNVQPTADLDIYTDASGVNTLIGITGRVLFTLREADIPITQLGASVPVVVRTTTLRDGGLIDVAAFKPARACRRGED